MTCREKYYFNQIKNCGNYEKYIFSTCLHNEFSLFGMADHLLILLFGFHCYGEILIKVKSSSWGSLGDQTVAENQTVVKTDLICLWVGSTPSSIPQLHIFYGLSLYLLCFKLCQRKLKPLAPAASGMSWLFNSCNLDAGTAPCHPARMVDCTFRLFHVAYVKCT